MKTKRYTLQEFIDLPGRTQAELARAIGVTQGAIYQMVRSDRNLFVVEDRDGIRVEEVRVIGRQRSAA